MARRVITRFAPAPTGMLHIGGARTALLNWAYAQKMGGQFFLRIEDTDIARISQAAHDGILDGLAWLGIGWDADPVYQSQNAAAHRAVAAQLRAKNKAYLCYASEQELAQMRTEAHAQGHKRSYNGLWRNRSLTEAPKDIAPVLRLKVPQDGYTVIDDIVQGKVEIPNDTLEDFILLRADQTPTYMLSVVVDDHEMGITHIVRGDDHLTNAAKQKILYEALGWDMPECAHIPLILDEHGKKLSKRTGDATNLQELRALGYFPEAVCNYLARLGWGHGDAEIFTMQEFCQWLELGDIKRAPARLDPTRLQTLNAHYLRQLSPQHLLKLLQSYTPKLSRAQQMRLTRAMPALMQRADTLRQLADRARVLLKERPIVPDNGTHTKHNDAVRAHLEAYAQQLSELKEWNEDSLNKSLKTYLETHNAKMGQLAPAIRAAVSGTTGALNLASLLYALGKDETILRINDKIK